MRHTALLMLLCLTLLKGAFASQPGDSTATTPNTCQCQEINDLEATDKDLMKRIEKLEERLKSTTCEEVCMNGKTKSKIYTIYPFHNRSKSLDVYCDFTIDLPGWITFQRRIDGSEDFYRCWNDYVNGFGKLKKEFWLGLETLHQLTSDKDYELRVDMEDFEGATRYAKYSTFKVGTGPGYVLQVSGYSGNAGDAMASHNGMKFTTRDKDQDATSNENCAQSYQGAWWYRSCHSTNPNGLYLGGSHSSYANGIEWNQWHGYNYSLKRIELKIRAKN